MESVIKQLVKIGHGMGAEVANDEPAVAKLLVELSSALDVQYERANALEAKCAALAAENAMLKQRTQQLIDIISNVDNRYCMCGSAMKDHVRGGCGYPTGMFDYYYNQWLESDNKTPATDDFLAEVRASELDSLAETMLVKFSNQQCSSDMHEVVGWKMVLQQVNNRAAELRKGVIQ